MKGAAPRREVGTAGLLLALALATAVPARGETIYGIVPVPGYNAGLRLVRFDSASPANILETIPITGIFDTAAQASLEFDPRTHELYGFALWNCQVLCPTFPAIPARIDPATGESTALDWDEFPVDVSWSDYDVDPSTRELRLLSFPGRNLRFSLDGLERFEDTDLDVSATFQGIAHTPGTGGAGVETYAILATQSGSQLIRLGGVGGVPPASSGEVTAIGSLDLEGWVYGFDISPSGTAYVVATDPVDRTGGIEGVNRLYTIDLATAALQEVGIIGSGGIGSTVSGIAVAPPGLGGGVLEVPALSPTGSVALVLLLAVAAWVRLGSRCDGSSRSFR